MYFRSLVGGFSHFSRILENFKNNDPPEHFIIGVQYSNDYTCWFNKCRPFLVAKLKFVSFQSLRTNKRILCNSDDRSVIFLTNTFKQHSSIRLQVSSVIVAGESTWSMKLSFHFCWSGHHFYENSTSGFFSFLKRWSHRQHVDKRLAWRQTINSRQATLASGFSVIR